MRRVSLGGLSRRLQVCYAAGSVPENERRALRLVALIREHGWQSFTSRDVLRLGRAGLTRAKDVNAALDALEDGDVIRARPVPAGPKGGRPTRAFDVNPAVHRVQP
jgi:hypothetical protein